MAGRRGRVQAALRRSAGPSRRSADRADDFQITFVGRVSPGSVWNSRGIHFCVGITDGLLTFHTMQVADIKEVVEREPFRPFAIRLNNGAQYTFHSPREVGATQEYNMIFFFGKTTAARIDTDSIVEVIEANE